MNATLNLGSFRQKCFANGARENNQTIDFTLFSLRPRLTSVTLVSVFLFEIAKAIEASTFGTYLRDSQVWFPLLNLFHVLGLLVAAGTVVFWDLRLLGIGLKRTPVSQVGHSLLPWTWGGFSVMFVTGSLLFTLEAGRLYENIFFRMKVLFLLLAGLNVLIFHFTVYEGVEGWDLDRATPRRARLAGALSLLLWLAILSCGRAIGYTLNYGA